MDRPHQRHAPGVTQFGIVVIRASWRTLYDVARPTQLLTSNLRHWKHSHKPGCSIYAQLPKRIEGRHAGHPPDEAGEDALADPLAAV